MMDGTPGDILAGFPMVRHRLTRRDYHRMAEAGVLGWNDRVELLEGQLVDMSPIGPRHALVTENLTELLITAVAGQARVRCQLPVVLDDGSEPQPDFAVVRRPWQGYPNDHPSSSDIFLLVEVSDSSLRFDRTVKLELYARAGIREVWIVDLTTDGVLVHRCSSEGKYASVVRIEAPSVLEVEDLPGVAIPVSRVFG